MYADFLCTTFDNDEQHSCKGQQRKKSKQKQKNIKKNTEQHDMLTDTLLILKMKTRHEGKRK